jgi:hypothetical protein
MAYGAVTVGDTATLIVAQNSKRNKLIIVNTSQTLTVYIGPDSSITTSNAIPLYPNQGLNDDKIPESYLGNIYGIVASSTANVRYWEKLQ